MVSYTTLVVSSLILVLSWPAFPFIYNRLYVKSTLERGYLPADEYSVNLLAKRGVMTNAAINTTVDEKTE